MPYTDICRLLPDGGLTNCVAANGSGTGGRERVGGPLWEPLHTTWRFPNFRATPGERYAIRFRSRGSGRNLLPRTTSSTRNDEGTGWILDISTKKRDSNDHWVDHRSDGVAMELLGRPLGAAPQLTETAAALSPDGRWLAYTSDGTGRREIWVRPYPGPGAPPRVSPDGGAEPWWSRDGGTLYYLHGRTMMGAGSRRRTGSSSRRPCTSSTATSATYERPPSYDVPADGSL